MPPLVGYLAAGFVLHAFGDLQKADPFLLGAADRSGPGEQSLQLAADLEHQELPVRIDL